jgi:hypothetical protein
MSHPAEGYPWAREITFALKLAAKHQRAAGYIEHDRDRWFELQNELAVKLLSIEQAYPKTTLSKWVTEGPVDSYVVQICRNYLVDLSRHAVNPLDHAQSIREVDEETGDVTEMEIQDRPELVPDSQTHFRRAVFLQALKKIPPRELTAIEEHLLELSDSSGLGLEGGRSLLKRAKKHLSKLVTRLLEGVESGREFYRVSPRVEVAHELTTEARLEHFPGWPGREWPAPARCPHGVQNLHKMGEPATTCSVCDVSEPLCPSVPCIADRDTETVSDLMVVGHLHDRS